MPLGMRNIHTKHHGDDRNRESDEKLSTLPMPSTRPKTETLLR